MQHLTTAGTDLKHLSRHVLRNVCLLKVLCSRGLVLVYAAKLEDGRYHGMLPLQRCQHVSRSGGMHAPRLKIHPSNPRAWADGQGEKM